MKFNDVIKKAKNNQKTLSVACADDPKVMQACYDAYREGISKSIFVGNKDNMEKIAKERNIELDAFKIIDEKDKTKAVKKAVELINKDEAQFLMKGYVDTSILLKGVLNKEWGLRTGRLLSHIALFEIDKYHKPFIITDGGMNIKPDLKTKMDIINNAADFYIRLGVKEPKIAILAAIEKVNPDMPETIDASLLAKMSQRKQISGIVDGPLAFDLAISKESAKHKKISSPVAGEADILVVPDLASGNILAKALIYMADSKVAGIIVGAKCPIVLLSRSDNEITKKMSIAMASLG